MWLDREALLQKPFILTPSHEAILKSVYTYYFLTAKQVCRLHYSPGSFTRVEKLLKELRDNQYLVWDFLPVKRRFGSSPAYYMLAKRGIGYLRTLGCDVSMLPYPSTLKAQKSLFIPHTLSVNDYLIAASLLSQTSPHIRLIEMKHELILKRTMKGDVVPDAWLDFRIHDKEQICLWLELDRQTQSLKKISQKIHSMVLFARNAYQQVFHTPSLTIVFATTGGSERLSSLIKWTEQELSQMREVHEGDLFRFASIPEGELDPQYVFFTPMWVRPFDRISLPLFEIQ